MHIHFVLSIFSLFFFTSFSYASITPQQFGAKADGVHDDTKALQAALDCRGKVFLPPGEYLISGKLIIHSDTQLFGEKGSTIKQTKDSFILYNEHSQVSDADWDCNISIRKIVFNGLLVDAVSEYTAGIYMCGVRNLVVEDCSLIGIGGDGIYLGRGGKDRFCERIRISNCFFKDCGRNATNPRQSIAVVYAEDVRIEKCTMVNNRKQSYAVDVEPNNRDEHCTVSITDCRMIGCGISCGGSKSAKKRIVVNKCYIDCSETENATLSVVRAGAKITGNTIIANGKNNGITIVTSPLAIVKKNSIRDASAGVLIADGADNVVIKSNTIENCSSGVYVIDSKGLAILANILKTKGKGVYIRKESRGTRIERNRIGSLSGIAVDTEQTEDVRIQRNKELD